MASDSRDPTHDLMPGEVAQHLPSLYASEEVDDPVVRLKWFTPDSSSTWYVLEFDPEQRLCFGLVVGHERELGYFSLDELLEVRGTLGLPVERDLHWQPTPLSKCP